MLKPDDRSHVFQLLRPPPGCRLDYAIGTTFSLDLYALLTLPVAFASMDWETAEGNPVSNPIVLLEAIRRHADRMSIFCQASRIAMPRQHQSLFAYLEDSITQVHLSESPGVFHPKIWVLRFLDGDKVLYRLLCLSRNLTFDRSWDTVVCLEGYLADRQLGIEKNRPLSEFVKGLPDLAVWQMPEPRRKQIARISDELRRVKFEAPEGFDDFEFWAGGPGRRQIDPFSERVDKGVIVSPFLSADVGDVLAPFLRGNVESVLVSRHEVLCGIDPAVLRRFKAVYFMEPELTKSGADAEEGQGTREESLEGLHAKIYVIDRGWDASVFTGSFNATHAAFHSNVEFMVELIGKKSRWGVDQFLDGSEGTFGFKSLLREFKPEDPWISPDCSEELWDRLAEEVRQLLVSARLYLEIEQEEDSLHTARLEVSSRPDLVAALEKVESIRLWPITLPAGRALSLHPSDELKFEHLSFEAISSLIAFEISAKIGSFSKTTTFVLNLPLVNPPADRLERVLASIIKDREKLFQLILLILSAGQGASLPANLRDILEGDSKDAGANSFFTSGLLERLLDALGNSSEQLSHVRSLIKGIQDSPARADLITDDFMRIWAPIAQAAQELEKR